MASRKCSACGQTTVTKVGVSGDNFKKLFKMPSIQEWVILAMLLMMLVLSYSYNVETKLCRETLEDLHERGLLNPFGVIVEPKVTETLYCLTDNGNQTPNPNKSSDQTLC